MKSILLHLSLVITLSAQIFISEIERNPPGSESTAPGGKSHEYIELVNLTADTLAIDSIVLTDGVVRDQLESRNGARFFTPGSVLLVLDPDYFPLAETLPIETHGATVATVNHSSLCGGLSGSDGVRFEYGNRTIAELRDSADEAESEKLTFTGFEGKETDELTLSPNGYFLKNGWRSAAGNPGEVNGLEGKLYYETDLNRKRLIIHTRSFRDEWERSVTISGKTVHTFRTLPFEFSTDTVPLPDSLTSLMITFRSGGKTVEESVNLSLIQIDPHALEISEILPRGDGEFIELRNRTEDTIILDGWKIANSEDTFSIADGTVIEAGAYLVFSKSDISPFKSEIVGDWFSLDNYRDSLYLLSPWGVHDSAAWDYKNYDDWGEESLHRIEGSSGFSPTAYVLGVISPGDETALASDATPHTLAVTPETFTPNGDGRDDSLIITVTHPAHYSTNIRIFSISGEEVKQFELQGERGVWNGSTSSGTTARRGPYVVIAEFSSSNGRDVMKRKGVALWR